MNKLIGAMAALLAMVAVACGDDTKEAENKQEKVAESWSSAINIRYVDQDSLLANYNLAKDYEEFIMRTTSNYERQIQTKENELRQFATQIEQKRQTNAYLSQASYEGDLQKLDKMQKDAAAYIAELERKAQEENMRLRKEIQDSINSVLIDYNNQYHYDAILWKSVGAIWNDSLDVTADVLNELNARYTKVATK